MASPLGLAMLLVPATSCQQIIQVVTAGPLVGKFWVIALGQNSGNCVGTNGGRVIATGGIVGMVGTCASPVAVDANSKTAAGMQDWKRNEPVIDAALLRRAPPPCL